MLDRYELICPVAQGGMASVWLARMRGKHGFQKLVALKTILPTFAEDARFRRMLLDEARIASRIEHVNVAQTLDLGEQDGHLYLVMEWVDGDSLSKLDRALERASQTMPVPILLRVVVEACAGLHAAHELCDEHGVRLGVVHRDVSPQNILVSVKGQTKLIDFGIAKAQAAPSEETRAGILKGKLHYMPPEQALRKPVDRRADVWAVGAVLYRLLTRRTPYESSSPVTSLKLLTSLAPPPALPGHVEESLAALVMRALSPQPSERPATALELQTALERVAQASGGLATNQQLASLVSEHLGQPLQERRDRIGTALRSASDVATVTRSSTRGDAGSSSAVTLQMASERAPRAQRTPWPLAVAASALAGLCAWALWPAPAPVAPRAASGAPSLRTAPTPPPASPEPPVPAAAPGASAEPQHAQLDVSALPPPVAPSALPLSSPARERATASTQPTRPASSTYPPRKKALAQAAAPKRKVIDDGF